MEPEDLIKYGLIPEFVGRLPVVGTLHELDRAALVQILTQPRNAITRQYQKLFEYENVKLKFTDDSLEAIAEQALARKIGARGLRMIIEELMLDLMYTLPGQKKVRECVITREVVMSKEKPITLDRKSRLATSRRFMELYETLPIVPLRDVVVFPHMMMPFVIGRPSSTRALEHALGKDKRIFLAAQHDAAIDEPQPNDIYTMGCVANIVQSLKLPDGNIKVLVEGIERARAVEWKEDKGFYRVVVKVVPKPKEAGVDAEATMTKVVSLFEQYVKLSNNLHYDAMIAAVRVDDPGKLADTISAHLVVGVDEKQNLLEIISPIERLNRITALLEAEVDKLQVDRKIQSRVKKQMEKAQKEYYLNEKMKAIQKELGRKDEKGNEIEELKKKIEQSKMPEEVEEKAIQELKRLESMPPMSAEATVSRNYLDWLIAVPVAEEDQGEPRSQARRGGPQRGPLRPREDQGPHPRVPRRPRPGQEAEGDDPHLLRTSGRRQDVAGQVDRARDEPQVRPAVARRRARRGRNPRPPPHLHRRVPRPDHPDDEEGRLDEPGVPARRSRQDVDGLPRRPVGGAARGARPGTEQRVPRSLPRRRVRPVERDVHLHGQRAAHDPAGAARPHGSAAARRLHRAGEGRDRAQVPGAEGGRRARASTKDNIVFLDEAFSTIISRYTREAGVRNLEREIASICRKVARKVVTEGKGFSMEITAAKVTEYLGVPRFRSALAEEKNEIGVATGLAWTEVGGEILTIEATLMPGKGKLTLTGKLGDVMQESAQAAMSYVRVEGGRVPASRRTSTARPTSTSTFPKGRSRRTARRPASRWRPR